MFLFHCSIAHMNPPGGYPIALNMVPILDYYPLQSPLDPYMEKFTGDPISSGDMIKYQLNCA